MSSVAQVEQRQQRVTTREMLDAAREEYEHHVADGAGSWDAACAVARTHGREPAEMYVALGLPKGRRRP